MRVRRIVGEKFWRSVRICRGRSDFFGRMLWARGLKCQDNRILGHLFAGKGVFTPSEGRLSRRFEHLLNWKWSKTDERKGVHGVPLSRLRGFVGVSGIGACKMVALWRPSQRRRCHARQTGL